MSDVPPSVAEVPSEESIDRALERLDALQREIDRRIVGHRPVIEGVLAGLLAAGHVLLEGVPGLGKTLLVKSLSDALELRFSRIQFTPDLMPADIIGTQMVMQDDEGGRHFRFQPGPVFTQLLLADEINRATPKTQSALLEAMEEQRVTVGRSGHPLPEPFMVLATQNPIEMEGTYQLPEAQIDRFFFKVKIPYPSEEVLGGILDLTTGVEEPEPNQILKPEEILRFQRLTRAVPMASHVQEAVVKFVLSTQPDQSHSDEVRRFVRHGVSPRGAQALILASKAHALLLGRYNVSFEDLEETLLPALRHRFQLNFEGEAEGVSAEDLLSSVFKRSLAARA